ncbi:tetratricopeptide repeat protein 19 homolog, mitochondrial [Plutella xylostella]|uniref:tetratricopeptide repeat protein 19 homolog, mitochondrial n=1 Tax=Plutella xylostella TaxID=51655 RepID=UPI00203231A5|nr:tetratricopeptide repeat protein 19 homolog, mitochondrial [Plutella xylostella]
MSFSIRCCRYVFTRITRAKINRRAISKIAIHCAPGSRSTVPCALGFTLYTLLGFEKKTTAEDELIETIKHCILFIQRNEFVKGEQLLHVALRQAQQVNNQLAITYIYDVMANLALEREQFDKAKTLFINVTQRLMADGAKEDDLRVIHISIKLARISHLQKEYATAQIGYDWCLQKLNKASNLSKNVTPLIMMTEDWYGRLFLECNQAENGSKLMLSALERMKTDATADKEHIIQQMSDLGAVYCEYLGKVDEGISFLKEAIETAKDVAGYNELGPVYVNLGRAYMKKRMLEEARKSCGYGWKLGYLSKNEEVQQEAQQCIKEINNLTT